jgi:hypothetical protein
MSFSRRVLHIDPCPRPALGQARRRDGIPAPAFHALRQDGTLHAPVILVRAPRVPVPPGTHGESRALTDRNSLTVHGSTSQLTPCGSPLLCKAVLLPILCTHLQDMFRIGQSVSAVQRW